MKDPTAESIYLVGAAAKILHELTWTETASALVHVVDHIETLAAERDRLREALHWLWNKTEHFTCQFTGEHSDKMDEIDALLVAAITAKETRDE